MPGTRLTRIETDDQVEYRLIVAQADAREWSKERWALLTAGLTTITAALRGYAAVEDEKAE